MSNASVVHLEGLRLSEDRYGPWKLYVFDVNSEFHRGGVWFMDKPKYPEEGEISTGEAFRRCCDAQSEGRQVRVCDGGDNLVFHARGDEVLHGETFWKDVLK